MREIVDIATLLSSLIVNKVFWVLDCWLDKYKNKQFGAQSLV